jgi:flagellar motor switch protein FliM
MSHDGDILTPEESNALLEASEADAQVPAESGVREIEPTYWEQVRPDRVPAFDAINVDVAEGLEKLWRQQYKTAIVVSAEPIRTQSWRELAERTADAPCVSLIEFKTQGRRGIVVLQPDTISAMVDLYFGGAGDMPRSSNLGELTEMERRQMQRFADAFVQTLREAWSRYGRFEINRSPDEYEPDVAPLCAPSEPVVSTLFLFVLGDREHRIEVCVPAALVQQLKAPARPALPGARQRPGLDWQARLREDVKEARVELRAVLGGSTVTLADIAKAKLGDIIATEPLTRVSVYAGSKAVFEGTLGARGGFNAVKISQAINKRSLGDR